MGALVSSAPVGRVEHGLERHPQATISSSIGRLGAPIARRVCDERGLPSCVSTQTNSNFANGERGDHARALACEQAPHSTLVPQRLGLPAPVVMPTAPRPQHAAQERPSSEQGVEPTRAVQLYGV